MFVDPSFVDDPTEGDDIATAWGDVVNDDLMALAAGPACKVVRTTSQTIASDTDTLIEWDTQLEDTHGMWSPGAPTDLIVPSGWPGGYVVELGVGWQVFADGLRHADIYVYGSRVVRQDTKDACSTGECDHSLSVYLPDLAEGSLIQARVKQVAGPGFLDIVAFDDSLSMSARWVRLPSSYVG